MNKQVIKNERLHEEFIKIKHPSGLTILLYPMKGYSSAYALFGTNFGSVDTTFKTNKDDDFIEVPEGVAHFLEHKLFENEDGDAFSLFASTGASANAYTSFDRTCYLFSTTDNFEKSLESLLSFVQSPYFTKETIEKEQGIIGQEIRMYDDNPGWRVFFNLLDALYVNHPVKIDIAGTVESISKIDDQVLYRCYNTFYNLNNMVLSIAGNIAVDTVMSVVEKSIKPCEELTIETKEVDEPKEIARAQSEQKLEVAVPLFNIGFKENPCKGKELVKNQVVAEILLEIIAGEGSDFYRKMYDEGLINSTFGTEVMNGRGYFCEIFAGESRKPHEVFENLKAEIGSIKQKGIESQEFERVRKLLYGRYVRGFNNVEGVANSLVLAHFTGTEIYDTIEAVANVSLNEVNEYLKNSLNPANCAISVINPL
ncbi:MAG: putative Zn-dependent peptidase [Oscillospiraceae bacterium]|nr:putative Zn-dependent peptidase [Oscillospiraceae bacterium]